MPWKVRAETRVGLVAGSEAAFSTCWADPRDHCRRRQLTHADWQTLASLPAASLPAPIRTAIKPALARLPPRVEERKKAELDEMMGKLKGLGNSILGSSRSDARC